jgi:branched-subunit amino acid ABC-type transport system permease component
MKLFLLTLLNGLTLAGLYFLLASGFTLIFGLMRYVNMAHGSILLFAAYVGYTIQDATSSLSLAVLGGVLAGDVAGIPGCQEGCRTATATAASADYWRSIPVLSSPQETVRAT